MADGRSEMIHGCIDLLIRSMRLHHKIVEKRVDGMGVHHSQHRLLMRLSKMERCASQRDIADAMDVSPACVARALKPLEASGLVEKAESEDGRCNLIRIRPEGQRVVDDSLALFRRIGEEMFEGVPEAELMALQGLMKRVYDNLSNMDRSDMAPAEDENAGAAEDGRPSRGGACI